MELKRGSYDQWLTIGLIVIFAKSNFKKSGGSLSLSLLSQHSLSLVSLPSSDRPAIHVHDLPAPGMAAGATTQEIFVLSPRSSPAHLQHQQPINFLIFPNFGHRFFDLFRRLWPLFLAILVWFFILYTCSIHFCT